jgi:DNA-directed RNA polymerase specialized sigma subunit
MVDNNLLSLENDKKIEEGLEKYSYLIDMQADRYGDFARRICDDDREELIADGKVGLVEALLFFGNIKEEYTFKCYASLRIFLHICLKRLYGNTDRFNAVCSEGAINLHLKALVEYMLTHDDKIPVEEFPKAFETIYKIDDLELDQPIVDHLNGKEFDKRIVKYRRDHYAEVEKLEQFNQTFDEACKKLGLSCQKY